MIAVGAILAENDVALDASRMKLKRGARRAYQQMNATSVVIGYHDYHPTF